MIKLFLTGIIFISLVGIIGVISIVNNFSPFESNTIVILFYLSLFIGSSGIFTLIGFLIRVIFKKSKLQQINDSFRQGVLLSTVLIGCLFLQSKGILYWWSALILVGTIGIVEYLLS